MANKFDQLFKEFSGLNYEDKKQKVIAMLDYIKDKMSMAQAISIFIQNNPTVTDDFLERNYSLIMKTAIDNNDNIMTAEEQQRLEQMASIKKMNNEKEQKDEQEADNMLSVL